jgi:hypothetical protein
MCSFSCDTVIAVEITRNAVMAAHAVMKEMMRVFEARTHGEHFILMLRRSHFIFAKRQASPGPEGPGVVMSHVTNELVKAFAIFKNGAKVFQGVFSVDSGLRVFVFCCRDSWYRYT